MGVVLIVDFILLVWNTLARFRATISTSSPPLRLSHWLCAFLTDGVHWIGYLHLELFSKVDNLFPLPSPNYLDIFQSNSVYNVQFFICLISDVVKCPFSCKIASSVKSCFLSSTNPIFYVYEIAVTDLL